MSSPAIKNEEEPLVKNQKKTLHILSLPDDLILSCLARVSRLHYPTLSLVSKSFRSLLASPELYKTRSLLGRTESCLYVCLRFPPEPNKRWFTLSINPNQTVDNKKTSCTLLIPIPTDPYSHPAHFSSLVAVGCNIYNFGGSHVDGPSSRVSILDCKSHTWREGPTMQVDRTNLSPNVLDGKIYVGGLKGSKSAFSMGVFDLKTETWDPTVFGLLPSPSIKEIFVYKSMVMEGGVYMIGDKEAVVYKPKEGKWESVHYLEDFDRWLGTSHCVIGNVLYWYHYHNTFKWYDSKIGKWMELKGLEGLLKFSGVVKLVDYGGKMAVLWDEYNGRKNKVIRCAVIELERRNSEEIWGKVEWLDDLLTVPVYYDFLCALSATV
ncbi:hypothetical protein CARUB_v10002890mg [Capsella rubella]|uniref:F-box domain-containing protein n=1 Tax=Capsella rubella TaxID=81985 RepID=R0GRV6_9BRAS|nr:F-box/kelch-repeat protein At5g49000 [Capsella rubella]EOA19614.1 hypothetical protein CARUB_v10002890mg [Capsella rubella]